MSGTKGHSGGRNRLSTAEKKRRGTLRKVRQALREPRYTVGLPTPPGHLTARARAFYLRVGARLVANRVLTEGDGERLALLAHSHDEFLAADELVRDEGMVLKRRTEDGDETSYRHPACIVRDGAWRRYVDGLRAFGLDPQSRGGVSVIDDEKEDPEAQYFQ
jgi:P27 family predicted phage terminase small subunit